MKLRNLIGPALGAVLLLGGAAASAKDELVVVTPGGQFEKALKEHFFDPFTKATGVEVISVSATSPNQWAKVKAMTETKNVEWDVVSSIPNDLTRSRVYLEKLDCAKLPNAEKFGVSGACMDYGLLRNTGAGVMTWNTAKYPAGAEPKDWVDFFDVKKFPGKRALMDAGYEGWMMMIALVADGVPADKLFPLDVDRAIKKLETLKPNISVWWKTGDQSQSIMRSGEADMTILWSGRAISLVQNGVPVKFTWNQGIRDPGIWSILKESPHKASAYKFLDFYMGNPEAHLAFSRQMVYDTSNRVATEMVSDAEKPLRATTSANWSAQLVPNWEWIANNEEMLQKRFAEMLAK